MNIRRLLLVIALVAVPMSASGSIITFDVGPSGNLGIYTTGGVTFSSVHGVTRDGSGLTPNGTYGLIDDYDGFYGALRADISGGATAVSVDIGDFNADADTIYLEAYNSSNVLIDIDSFSLPGSFVGMYTLSVSAAGISYVRYGGVGVAGSSVYTDNFSFAGVPEPSTLMIVGLGLGCMGLIDLRRRR